MSRLNWSLGFFPGAIREGGFFAVQREGLSLKFWSALSPRDMAAHRTFSVPILTVLAVAAYRSLLSVNALGNRLPLADREPIAAWLMDQQYRGVHPFTGAAPGGWAWTDLPGGTPDADDTAGALVALHTLGLRDPKIIAAATSGVRWLLDLQNRDGGIPTFCRGWGKLPFDRSSADITAHALHAWSAWRLRLWKPRRDERLPVSQGKR